MTTDSDTLLRTVLGDNLQTGALRAILILAAFAFVGAFFSYIFL